MNDHIKQQFEALYGPLQRGDYDLGAVIRFRSNHGISRGEIIWIAGPGTTASGKHHGLFYVVDTGGFPELVAPAEIVTE